MKFDTEQLEIMFRARVLGPHHGQVLEPWAYPQAIGLMDAGWLERRWTDDHDVAWFLSEKAEVASELHALTADVKRRHN